MGLEKPVYQKIGEEIKNTIIKEKLANNYKLPSENDFVDRFGVSRTTIQRALRYLENQGIVRREKGKGSFVDLQHAKIDIFNFSGFSDYLAKRGSEVENRVLNKLRYEQNGEAYMKLERLRGVKKNGEVSWLTRDCSILSMKLFPDIDKYDFEKRSLYNVIRAEYGAFPQYAHLKSKAVISNEDCKKYFCLQSDTALVQVVGKVFGTKNELIEEVSILYSPDIDFNFLVSV